MVKKDGVKIGILGYGEVGKAIAEFYRNPKIKDLNRDDGLRGVEVLHICIPWNKSFITIAKQEIQNINPELTIIHSTIPVGTTKKIISSLPRACRGVVHSPIRGIHPNLYKGIKTFVKYIGADNKRAGEAAKKHLENLGIKTKVFESSKTTEALKLWDTTQYAWQILLNKSIKKWCDKEGLNFEAVYTDPNKTYNEGYQKLGKTEVMRPYLKYIPGGVGGHCVLENTILLRESSPEFSQIFDLILGMGKNMDLVSEEKPYFNRTWLYAEYWGKGRSTGEIAKEYGCTEENILHVMRSRNVPRRDRRWTQKQIEKILKLSEKGKTFKEIAKEEFEDKKTYSAIRNVAYNILKIKSPYNPAIINEETRQKISASLQGIALEDWDGFKETLNALTRKSTEYHNWRNKIFKRDNYTCQNCQKRGTFLISHHIKNFANNLKWRMKINNGITLCKKCHLDFHNKYGRINNSEKQMKEYLGK